MPLTFSVMSQSKFHDLLYLKTESSKLHILKQLSLNNQSFHDNSDNIFFVKNTESPVLMISADFYNDYLYRVTYSYLFSEQFGDCLNFYTKLKKLISNEYTYSEEFSIKETVNKSSAGEGVSFYKSELEVDKEYIEYIFVYYMYDNGWKVVFVDNNFKKCGLGKTILSKSYRY